MQYFRKICLLFLIVFEVISCKNEHSNSEELRLVQTNASLLKNLLEGTRQVLDGVVLDRVLISNADTFTQDRALYQQDTTKLSQGTIAQDTTTLSQATTDQYTTNLSQGTTDQESTKLSQAATLSQAEKELNEKYDSFNKLAEEMQKACDLIKETSATCWSRQCEDSFRTELTLNPSSGSTFSSFFDLYERMTNIIPGLDIDPVFKEVSDNHFLFLLATRQLDLIF